MDVFVGVLGRNHHQNGRYQPQELQNEDFPLGLTPGATLGVPGPMMPTVLAIPAPPAAGPVSVVVVAGIGVESCSAKAEDFHDPHVPILSLAPGTPLPGRR